MSGELFILFDHLIIRSFPYVESTDKFMSGDMVLIKMMLNLPSQILVVSYSYCLIRER